MYHIKQLYTVYHESFEAEKFCGFHGFLVLCETFFHENISVAIEKRALIAITMGIRESFFREDLCDALTAKVFCLETFLVYGIW